MAKQGWIAAGLDDVEAVPWRGTELVWRPVRAALGARVAGISAYTADTLGQELVEDHVEDADGRGHEEVYLVVRGRARFLLAGEELDAPAGTFVCVAPHVRRSATAVEAPAAVVVIGGEPDYEPAASEWIERARPWFRDDPGRARKLLDELAEEQPGSAAVSFAEALFAAARGELEDARSHLDEAIRRAPGARDFARREPTLAPLLDDP
jgi:mannose-6-phosphate isomerase-like protein (cupin superfamily)